MFPTVYMCVSTVLSILLLFRTSLFLGPFLLDHLGTGREK